MAAVVATMTAARRRLTDPTRALIRDLAAWQEAIADRVIEDLREYPAELEGQRYVRTYRLQRGWDKTPATFRGGLGVTCQVFNFATDNQGRHYSSHVQGHPNEQLDIHVGRWLTIDEAMFTHRNEYRAGIREILDSHGFTRR